MNLPQQPGSLPMQGLRRGVSTSSAAHDFTKSLSISFLAFCTSEEMSVSILSSCHAHWDRVWVVRVIVPAYKGRL